ncbi:hypothetical protein SOP93_00045 [Peribacillus frigoritolerans]|uniref:hypothetical protein n=1 Tax=Peribacillus frigoritolerans TaxID=450367 RepID=UPI002B2562DF|nr:hypothetical protein [Peribacillus frigoritolerans]MEB2489566.1 hypothetical protein [Peribacillus frigoritolerans]
MGLISNISSTFTDISFVFSREVDGGNLMDVVTVLVPSFGINVKPNDGMANDSTRITAELIKI